MYPLQTKQSFVKKIIYMIKVFLKKLLLILKGKTIKENTYLELTDFIELNRSTDVEVDNLIENGGSNIFAYLFKISS